MSETKPNPTLVRTFTITKLLPAEPATIAAWLRWVFEGSRDLPRCLRKCWHGDRRVAAPVRRSESPTGYSSAGCFPAEPASASPVTDHRSSIPMRCLVAIQRRAAYPPPTGVSSLLCTPGDICILRRQSSVGDPVTSVGMDRLRARAPDTARQQDR